MTTIPDAGGSFEFDCPHCLQSLEALLELEGQNLNCPICGKAIIISSQAAKREIPVEGSLNESSSRRSIPLLPDIKTSRPSIERSISTAHDYHPAILRERLISLGEKAWDLMVIAFDKKPSLAKIQRTQIERAKRRKDRLKKDAAPKFAKRSTAATSIAHEQQSSIIRSSPISAVDGTLEVVTSMPLSSSGLRRCPFCSEDINANAVKCKHCGEFFDSRIRSLASHASQRTPQIQLVQQVVVQQSSGCAWIIIIALGIIVAVVVISFF